MRRLVHVGRRLRMRQDHSTGHAAAWAVRHGRRPGVRDSAMRWQLGRSLHLSDCALVEHHDSSEARSFRSNGDKKNAAIERDDADPRNNL